MQTQNTDLSHLEKQFHALIDELNILNGGCKKAFPDDQDPYHITESIDAVIRRVQQIQKSVNFEAVQNK